MADRHIQSNMFKYTGKEASIKLIMGKASKLSEERARLIRDEIFCQLRKAIVRRVYKPGEKLREETLAEQLGTSRTPVREALRKLESEKLVNYYPHKGAVVSEISKEEMEDLFAIRALLEKLIIRRAAMKAKPEDIQELRRYLEASETPGDADTILDAIDAFNEKIFEIAGASQLADINRRVRECLQRMLVSNHLDPVRSVIARTEHMKIVEALEAGDPELAEKYVEEHTKNATEKSRH